MKAMILAAGRGERMRPLTDTRPKPMLAVGGKPLIEYHVESLRLAGITHLVINLSWRGDQIRRFLGNGVGHGVDIVYSDEGPEALETGGGIFHALPVLGDAPFWLVNADVYSDYPFTLRGLPPGISGHLVLVPNPPHHPEGDFCLVGDHIRNTGALRYTYSGIAILSSELLAGCRPGTFPLAPLLAEAADQGRLTGELFCGTWRDVGTPARLAELNDELAAAT